MYWVMMAAKLWSCDMPDSPTAQGGWGPDRIPKRHCSIIVERNSICFNWANFRIPRLPFRRGACMLQVTSFQKEMHDGYEPA